MPAPPIEVPAPALAELKAWLRITTPGEDDLLVHALGASIDLCERFIGALLLEREVDEDLSIAPVWQRLGCMPVSAILTVVGRIAEEADFALPVDAYAIDIRPDGIGRVRVLRPGAAGRVRVRYTAGLAAEWDDLPQTLRQGVMRHAAWLYQERGATGTDAPAAVAALWQPWRRILL